MAFTCHYLKWADRLGQQRIYSVLLRNLLFQSHLLKKLTFSSGVMHSLVSSLKMLPFERIEGHVYNFKILVFLMFHFRDCLKFYIYKILQVLSTELSHEKCKYSTEVYLSTKANMSTELFLIVLKEEQNKSRPFYISVPYTIPQRRICLEILKSYAPQLCF